MWAVFQPFVRSRKPDFSIRIAARAVENHKTASSVGAREVKEGRGRYGGHRSVSGRMPRSSLPARGSVSGPVSASPRRFHPARERPVGSRTEQAGARRQREPARDLERDLLAAILDAQFAAGPATFGRATFSPTNLRGCARQLIVASGDCKPGMEVPLARPGVEFSGKARQIHCDGPSMPSGMVNAESLRGRASWAR
jgi:hypothetical protein